MSKIYIRFEGVACLWLDGPDSEEKIIGPPTEGFAEAVRELRKTHQVFIYSNKLAIEAKRKDIVSWFIEHQITIDGLTEQADSQSMCIDREFVGYADNWDMTLAQILFLSFRSGKNSKNELKSFINLVEPQLNEAKKRLKQIYQTNRGNKKIQTAFFLSNENALFLERESSSLGCRPGVYLEEQLINSSVAFDMQERGAVLDRNKTLNTEGIQKNIRITQGARNHLEKISQEHFFSENKGDNISVTIEYLFGKKKDEVEQQKPNAEE
jgi:hypothetical protein